jgi:hypothetical protein
MRRANKNSPAKIGINLRGSNYRKNYNELARSQKSAVENLMILHNSRLVLPNDFISFSFAKTFITKS